MLGRLTAIGGFVAALAFPVAAHGSTSINYGPISHSGLKDAGAASGGLKLSLELGLIANQSGIQTVAKNASNPSSSSYGKYSSVSSLQKNYGASSSKSKAVISELKKYGVSGSLDVTHLRIAATMTVKTAQKMFGVHWHVYSDGSNQYVALPTAKPKAPSGISGNVDTIAGVRLNVSASASRAGVEPLRGAHSSDSDGGTPTRTGTPNVGCTPSQFPSAVGSTTGLFPNQILDAYGIAALQSQGLRGQGETIAIVGEGPAVTSDLNTFRNCFGFQGTSLGQSGSTSLQPILESALDTQVVSMVAPQLAHFYLYIHPIDEGSDDGDLLGFLKMVEAPLQATAKGAALPNVISVSYGVCEAQMSKYTASRTLIERQLAATAALGITTVVAAGDSGSSSCAHGVPANQLTTADKAESASYPASSAWVLAAGGTNITLNADNSIAATGVWNDTAYGALFNNTAGGGGGVSTFESRPAWQPAIPSQSKYRMVPDVAVFADESPGYVVVCSSDVESCPHTPTPTISYVGGTSAAAPLMAGMIALWDQQARQNGWPKPGFVTPLIYSVAHSAPSTFLDITQGNNMVFSGLNCCSAATGFDLASGNGSPIASAVIDHLKH
jgi:subtilase family serine protease